MLFFKERKTSMEIKKKINTINKLITKAQTDEV